MRRTGKNGERTLKRVAKSLLAALMLPGLIALSSCNDNLGPDNPDPNARVLTVRVTVPGMPATKAASGDVTGVDPESMIYNVQVWMFNHQAAGATTLDSEAAVAYATLNISGGWTNTENRASGYYDQWTNTTTYEVPMKVPSSVFDRDANNMKFDFYVLANGPSIGSQLSESSTRAQIKAATFGVQGALDPFGTNVPKAGATPRLAINGGSDAGPGLPISGFFNRPRNSDGTTSDEGTGVDLRFLKNKLSADEAKKLSPVVQLDRAVSKLRFVFAKPEAMDGVSVTRIELDANLIPDATFVFPREDGTLFAMPSDAGYMPNTANIGSLESADILGVEDPTVLRSDSQLNANKTAQQYEDYLTTVIGNKTSTQRFAYFRESDKPITGKIYYKLSDSDTEDKVAVFTMSGLANTNFYRNHSWLVYSYFTGNGLYIKPIVLPWEDGSSYTYNQFGSAVVAISQKKEILFGYGWTTSYSNPWWLANKDLPNTVTEWYFRRQDEGYTDNWNYDWLHSQMISAPGLNAGGAPIYANRIELRTNGFIVPLRLKLSNPDDFYIVTYNAASADYVKWTVDSQPAGYDEADGALIPVTISAGGTTYFYVVPKEGAAHQGKITRAYLVTDPTDGSGSQKLPFNAGVFPGSNENTEINFYSVSVDTFKGYYTTRPDNVKPYDHDGEVTI